MLCAGIAIIAACLLIPQADANRRLVYERTKLQADLEAVEKQVAVNDEFLRKVADDANLAERLAQRQMKMIRQGTRILAHALGELCGLAQHHVSRRLGRFELGQTLQGRESFGRTLGRREQLREVARRRYRVAARELRVGEHSPVVRAEVAARVATLGIEVDIGANEAAAADAVIGEGVVVVTAREDIEIAAGVRSVLGI
jgi:hypothetical protein